MNKFKMKKVWFINLVALCFMLSCVSLATTETLLPAISSDKIQGKDYRALGSVTFSSSEGSIKSASGCTVNYTQFLPNNYQSEVVVILAHGFFRNQKTQKQLAEHLASWGLNVVTVDFCNSKPWNGHHDKNGADMVLVANALNARSVIYSGFSAGGLAAIIASSLDTRTKAYLGLDMVDNFEKGIAAAPQVTAPVFGLVAESSMCNAKNNGLEAYNKIEQANLYQISGARHCDFEYPFDKKCSLACGKTKAPYAREDVQSTILGLTTALLLWQSGLDTEAKSWWENSASNTKLFIENNRIELFDK